MILFILLFFKLINGNINIQLFIVSAFRMIKLFSLKQQKAEDEAAGKTGQKKTSAAQLRNVLEVVSSISKELAKFTGRLVRYPHLRVFFCC